MKRDAIACDELVEAAADLLGGEATPARRAALASHLAECAACARELEGLEATLSRVRAWSVPEPDAAYWTSRLPDRRRLASRPVVDWGAVGEALVAALRPLAAAAAILAAALLALAPAGDTAPDRLAALAAPSEELTAAELAAVHELSRGLDALEPSTPLPDVFPLAGDDVAAARHPSARAGHDTSGDLFGFLGDTQDLSDIEVDLLLAALERETEG